MYVWGGAIKIGARPFWGRGVFVLVISNINIGFQKSLTTPLTNLRITLLKYLILDNINENTTVHRLLWPIKYSYRNNF